MTEGVKLTKAAKCRTCGGTGVQLLNRSWFRSDGYTRHRCGVCGGTGVSGYRDAPDFVREQARRRAALNPESAK